MSAHRLRQGALDGPAVANKPKMQSPHRYVFVSRPLRERQCSAFEGEPLIVAPVVRLSLRCAPLAVSIRVGAVVVEAIQRAAFRARTHVGVEAFERLAPCWFHRDSAGTIARILRVIRIEASAFCAFPASVFSRAASAVRALIRSLHFSEATAATLRVAGAQGRSCDRDWRSARAKASPIFISTTLRRWLQDEQSSECLTG